MGRQGPVFTAPASDQAERVRGAGGVVVRLVSDEERRLSMQRAGQRAAAVVKRIVREAQHDRLVTFTYPTPVRDYVRASELMRGFMHRFGASLFRRDYVMVPELHRTHGWHWHMTCRGWVDAVELRDRWTRWLVSEGVRLSDASRFARVQVEYRKSVRAGALGSYLAKYVTKSFVDSAVEPGMHRYSVGSSTPRPAEVEVQVDVEDEDDVMDVWRMVRVAAALEVRGGVGVWVEPTEGWVVKFTWERGRAAPR